MEEQFSILHSGEEYFAHLEQLIDSAIESIQIFVYTIEDDETGRAIIHSLLEARSRGVEIHFLTDAFGSKDFPESLENQLLEAGIHFRYYSSFLTGNIYSLGRRMHMKLVLVDRLRILIGGINFTNNYNDIDEKAWLDYAVSFISKEVGTQLGDVHHNIYYKKMKKMYEKYDLVGESFKILINDWLHRSNSIHKANEKHIEESEEEIIIMVSYFIPGFRFLKRLAKASKRGVKVNVINSAKWDIPFMHRAIRYLYPWMERNNIHLFEWQPTVLHAKVMIIDKALCSIGSYNLNGLSRYNSLEMNTVITEHGFVEKMRNEVRDLMKDPECIQPIVHYQPNVFQKMANWFSYRLVRLSLSIMFFLAKEGRNQTESATL